MTTLIQNGLEQEVEAPSCPICGKPMQFKKQGYSNDFGGDVRLYHCDGPSPQGDSCWTQKRVPVAKAAPTVVKPWAYGGCTGINDYLMSDGSIQTMSATEAKVMVK